MGAMSAADRRALFAQAVRLQGALLKSLLFRRGCIRGNINDITFPDSRMASDAARVCAEVSPPPLFNHCCRVYVWARLIAAEYDIAFDDELLYAGCMLHDLGLTSAYRDCARHSECFTLDSVEGASAVARSAGWDTARRDALAEAIVLHMNVVVGIEQGAEAHLLHDAAGLDCLGLRAWEIARATRNSVTAHYPRDDFKPFLLAAFTEEAQRRPHCRSQFLIRYMGFRSMVRLARV